jgi:hypothetical protein
MPEAIRHVDTTFQWLTGLTESWTASTQGAIASMAAWAPAPEQAPPTLKVNGVQFTPLPELSPPAPQSMEDIPEIDLPVWDSSLLSLLSELEMEAPQEFTPTGPIPTFNLEAINAGEAPDIYQPAAVEVPMAFDESAPSEPTFETISASGLPDAPGFIDPSLDLPDSPNFIQVSADGLPSAPTFVSVSADDLPGSPTFISLSLPEGPSLVVPPFDDGEVPAFDADVPDLQSAQWTAGTYTPLALNELTGTIKAMLDGGYAMPAAVQDALWTAAVDREDATARRAVDAATEEWAGRGFFLPPGMLIEQANAAREQAALAANDHSRSVFAKAADWQIENLRTAVAQGIAAETMWSQHWNTVEARLLTAAKMQVDILKDQFNLRALAFTTAIARIGALRDLFLARWQVQTAKLEEWRGVLELELAKGQVNEQNLKLFLGKVQAIVEREKLKGSVNELNLNKYLGQIKAKIDVEGLKATVNEQNLKLFLGEVQAIVEREKLKGSVNELNLNRYLGEIKAKIDAEGLKASVNEQNLKLFLGEVQAIVEREKLKGNINELNLNKYLGEIKAKIDAEGLKGTVNEQNLKLYLGKLERLRVLASVFSEKMNGARLLSEHERSMLETSKLQLEAWDRELQAKRDTRAQDLQVELGKVQFREIEARQFAAQVQATTSKDDLRMKFIQTQAGLVEASARKYQADISAQETKLRARIERLKARVASYEADQRYMAEQMRYMAQGEELKVRVAEANARNNLGYFDTVNRQFDARMQRLMIVSQQILTAIQEAGRMSAQMAAGAMSAVHASASISGSGSNSSSVSFSESHNYEY